MNYQWMYVVVFKKDFRALSMNVGGYFQTTLQGILKECRGDNEIGMKRIIR